MPSSSAAGADPEAGWPPTIDENSPLLSPPGHTLPWYLSRKLFYFLCFIIWLCFCVHLAKAGKVAEWVDSFHMSFKGDFLWALAWHFFLALTMMSHALLWLSTCSPVSAVVAYIFTMLWWSACLQLCVYHDLRVYCMRPAWCASTMWRDRVIPDIGSGFFSWIWFPVGFFECVLAIFWRPWWFLFKVAPMVLSGHETDLEFWQLRQVLIGTTFFVAAAFALQADNRTGTKQVTSAVVCYILVGCVFYSTTAPMVAWWSFVGSSCWKAAHFSAAWEEFAAAFLFVLCILWTCYEVWLFGWRSWEMAFMVERNLQHALDNPFHARMESWGDEQSLQFLRSFSRPVPTPQPEGLQGDEEQEQEEGETKDIERHNSLPFEEKRKFLLRAIQNRRNPTNRHNLFDYLEVSVSRENLLEESLAILLKRHPDELLAQSLMVTFIGEPALDAGGPSREWFDLVAKALADGPQDPDGKSLLVNAPDQTLLPRPIGEDSGEVDKANHDRYRSLLAVGRFLALAVARQRPLPLSFSTIACKHMLGKAVGMIDVKRLDPEFFRSRVTAVLRQGGLEELEAALGEPLYFMSAPSEFKKEPQELKTGGADIMVTDENKKEYVQLLSEAYLCNGIRREINCILTGFWELLPLNILQACGITPQELSLLISGVADLNVAQWEAWSDCGSEPNQVRSWFWEVLEGLNAEERSKVLHFTTGSSRLPPGGFEKLEPKFQVTISDQDNERLPEAHTCINQIVLRRYSTQEQLREKLMQAITAESFEFA